MRRYWRPSPLGERDLERARDVTCSAAPPTICSGCRATSSAPRTSRACSRSAIASRCCRARAPARTTSGARPAQRRLRRGLPRQVRHLRHAQCRQLHAVRRRQSLQRLFEPRHRAAQRARPAHRAHPRDVGEPQQRLDRVLGHRCGQARLQRAAAAVRLDQGALGAVPRRAAQHHPAQRHLLLQPARHVPGARRQHRAHPRRQILRAAAAQRDGRRRDRQRAVGGHPALGLRAPQLPLGLSRELQALAHRRLSHPQPPDAALAAILLRRDRRRRWCSSPASTTPATAASRSRSETRAAAGGRRHERYLPVGPARVPGGVHRPQQPPGLARSPPPTTSPIDADPMLHLGSPRHTLPIRGAGQLHHPELAADARLVPGPARCRLAGARAAAPSRGCSSGTASATSCTSSPCMAGTRSW